MKPLLTILTQGYARQGIGDTYVASPTCSLLQYNDKNYIVDPACNPELLLSALSKYSLNTNDIHAIFLTHYHLDHLLNIRLFPHTPLYDGSMKWEKDNEVPYTGYWLIPEFKVLHTPGHASEQYSLLVDTENYGLVCIAQDVFWWEDGKQRSDTVSDLFDLVDQFAANVTELRASRQLVLESGAKWIIPGHGTMFKNPYNG